MLSTKTIRAWSWLHKWTSLVCTVFMLLLCLTGLPLIFHDEIGHLLGTQVAAPPMPADTPMANLDVVLASAKAQYPGMVMQYLAREEGDDNIWYATLGEHPTDENRKSVIIDARTAQSLATPNFDQGFMYVMLKLHVDLFAGLPGQLFLGFMGLLLLVAVVSGVVLYAPFMRKLDFGTVRHHRSARTRWLDLHNLLGIITLVWVLVVGATGVINTWADLVIDYWQADQMAQMTAPYKNLPVPRPSSTKLASLQQSVLTAQAQEPHMQLGFVAFPGTEYSSPYHYGVFMRGNTPLTARLFKPVLIDAQTGQLTDSRPIPWYLATFLLSQPLHFGDYGGMPMKILWAILDVATIIVLGSGLYLWLKRKPANKVNRIRQPKGMGISL